MNIVNTIQRSKPTVLIVLDGLGVASPTQGNAVTLAKTPNMNFLWENYPHIYLQASGNYVGLPQGVVGNSEVGHMSIGAGKIVFQEIARIDKEIEDGIFYTNVTLKNAIGHIKKTNGRFHLMGLTSTGKVHSSMDHLYACLEFCKREGLARNKVLIHAFTDGRDTAPKSAITELESLEKKCTEIGVGRIATVVGRYFAMDRDERWQRTQFAYDLIVYGKGTPVNSWKEAVTKSYDSGNTDEYIKPFVITENEIPIGTVNPGDVVLFFNYRPDRAVQLAKAFEDDNFTGWTRQKIENLYFAGFSNYQKGIVMNRAKEDVDAFGNESKMVDALFDLELKKTDFLFPENQVFPPERVEFSLGRLISDAQMSQLRITESEKFPHVTYFFNCRENDPFPREDRVEIPSPKDVATYDLKPEMSAYDVTNELVNKINQNIYDFIVVNYALTDMVAHTGNMGASITSVEVADKCLNYLTRAVLGKGGELFITADHGNVEEMLNVQTGDIDTQHSTNPVPLIYVSNRGIPVVDRPMGVLADIAPTILASLGIEKPQGMTGRDLFS